jgi:hypothetical protein
LTVTVKEVEEPGETFPEPGLTPWMSAQDGWARGIMLTVESKVAIETRRSLPPVVVGTWWL